MPASKEFIKMEDEKTILLSLSTEIASLKKRTDLFRVVNATIKAIFSVNEYAIACISEDGNSYGAFMLDLDTPIKSHADFEQITTDSYSVDDYVFRTAMNSDEPVLFDVNELAKNAEVPAYVNFWKNVGLQKVLCLSLKAGGREIGCAFFHVDNSELVPSKYNLLKSICAQLAVAVSNILALEKIETRERETETLLLINTDFSAARNNNELLAIINNRPKKLLSFSHTAIAIINDDRTTLRTFLLDPESKSKDHPEYANAIKQNYSLDNEVINNILTSVGPVIYNLNQLQANNELPLFLKMSFESGIQQVIAMRFSKGDFVFGLWIMFFDVPITLSANKSRLVQGLSNQLSIAVSNILANEEIAKRDEEKTILLSLTTEIASLKNRTDLFRVVNTNIKEIFSVREYAIATITEDGNSYMPFMMDLDEPITSHRDFEKIKAVKNSVHDIVFRKVINSDEPVLFDVNELAQDPEVPGYFIFWKNVGLKKVLFLPLKAGGRDIGCAVFHLDNSELFPSKYNLLKSICAQLAVAVSNILALEEIEKRERETETLLLVNADISAARNNDELLQVINHHPKNLLSFSHTAIAIINDDRTTLGAFLLDPESKSKDHPEYANAIKQNYSLDNEVINKILTSVGPVVYDLKQLQADNELPLFLQMSFESGIQQVIAMRFSKGDFVFGLWMMFFDVPITLGAGRSRLVQELSNQLSIAVSNIMANLEIERREEEKSKLLAFSNALASVKDKNLLSKILKKQLQELFVIQDYAIHALSKDKKTHRLTLFDPDAPFAKHPDFSKLIEMDTDVNDGIFNKILASEDPVHFNVEEWYNSASPPTYAAAAKSINLKKMTGMPLRLGQENIGLINFIQDEFNQVAIQQPLFKSICSQLAFRLSNIIDSEEIQRREEEKSMLLEFSNAIASVRDKSLLAIILKKQLKQLFFIPDYVIHSLSEDKKTQRLIMFSPDAPFANHPDFVKMAHTDTDINDGVFNKILAADGPVIIDAEEWYTTSDRPTYSKAAESISLKKIAGICLRFGEESIGFLNFIADDLSQAAIQKPLFKSICSQIAVRLSNIIANEEIQGREREKARLLAFSNAMASVRDKISLSKILKGHLEYLFSIKDFSVNVLVGDKKSFLPLLYDVNADYILEPSFQKLLSTPTDIYDGVCDKTLNSEDPVTFNVEEWLSWEKPPVYMSACLSIGLKKMTGVRVRLGQENIGILNCGHNDFDFLPSQLNLLKSICSQIAIAVSNIIANEDIEGREREKARLLEFSNAMASVRDKFSLSKILKTQFQDLFSIKDFLVNVLVDNKQSFLPLLYDQDADFINDPAFQIILSTPTDIHDGVFDKTLSSEDPVTFNVEEWLTWEKPPRYLETAIAIGLKKMTAVRIRLGQDDIGVLNCRHDNFDLVPSQLNLLKSICSQIAIAVSNILANEKVSNQLDEINRYKLQLEEEKIYLKEEIETTQNYTEIIGESPAIKKVFKFVNQVSKSDSTVLLLGETGTGKELIARAIHNGSPRKNKLMIKVNCAALPANLIESELFGHERGSFTGATERRIGKFELANHGTLFLDEIGEMPLELQVKLLRALQEKEIERVGGSVTIKTDVRIIAATNRKLEKLIDEGRFRTDLYYRLNIFPIQLPPLRERPEDISALASHFILRFAKKAGKKITNLSNRALQELKAYHWPGNVRELEHLIERSVLLTEGDTIKHIHVPLPILEKTKLADVEEDLKVKTIDDNERSHILKILKYCSGRVSGPGGAAELLGVPPTTLNSKMKRLGIRKEHIS